MRSGSEQQSTDTAEDPSPCLAQLLQEEVKVQSHVQFILSLLIRVESFLFSCFLCVASLRVTLTS